jgi:arylformamidase
MSFTCAAPGRLVRLAVLACFGAASLMALLAPGVAGGDPAAGYVRFADIDYRTASGQPGRNQLDVYTPRGGAGNAPVVVWVHGGAWYQGSKRAVAADKAARFTRAGYVFVAVNYRLSPRLGDRDSLAPGRVMFPDHPRDVAAAVGWVDRNIHRYGGDARRIVLMGHSAGGQIVSLIATDRRYLVRAGVAPRRIRGVISLDAVAFDMTALVDPESPTRGFGFKPSYWNAFGTPRENRARDRWRQASAIEFAGPKDPPFLFVVPVDEPRRMWEARKMAERLRQNEGHAILPVAKDHREINHHFGNERDAGGQTVRAMAFTHAVTRARTPVRADLRARATRFGMAPGRKVRKVATVAASRPVGARSVAGSTGGPSTTAPAGRFTGWPAEPTS